MTDIIKEISEDHISVIKNTIDSSHDKIIEIVNLIKYTFDNNRKVFIFGNGGSASDANHVAAEFLNRFEIERRPLPVISLNSDVATLTAISNDYSFSEVFTKQLFAMSTKGDLAIGISTSGQSNNVMEALGLAKSQLRMSTILFTGKLDGPDYVDITFNVNSTVTARIQETHILTWHIICKMIDDLFK